MSGLDSRIKAAVNKAFLAADDLVESGTLSSKKVTNYDFSQRSTISSSSTQTVDVIIESAKKPNGEGFIITALMKSGVDLTVYDTLTVGTDKYAITDYTDNKFVITAILSKER